MTDTPLDLAHAAMQAAAGDTSEGTAARLGFFGRLADAQLHVLLSAEPGPGAPAAPRVFDLSEGPVVAAFDLLDRLADFADGAAPHATLSGRQLAAELGAGALGLLLNPGVKSQILLPASAMAWLAETLRSAPRQTAVHADEIGPPGDLPAALLAALESRFATLAGLAASLYLARVRVADSPGAAPLVAFLDAVPGAESALAGAIGEALVFSGIEDMGLDVTFVTSGSRAAAALSRVALRIDLSPRDAPPRPGPGQDPGRPPRLK